MLDLINKDHNYFSPPYTQILRVYDFYYESQDSSGNDFINVSVDKQLTKKKMFRLTMFYMYKGEIYPFLEDQISEG
jgi:hypothetical protein